MCRGYFRYRDSLYLSYPAQTALCEVSNFLSRNQQMQIIVPRTDRPFLSPLLSGIEGMIFRIRVDRRRYGLVFACPTKYIISCVTLIFMTAICFYLPWVVIVTPKDFITRTNYVTVGRILIFTFFLHGTEIVSHQRG